MGWKWWWGGAGNKWRMPFAGGYDGDVYLLIGSHRAAIRLKHRFLLVYSPQWAVKKALACVFFGILAGKKALRSEDFLLELDKT